MKTEWIQFPYMVWGDVYGDEHTTLHIGLKEDGVVLWQKHRHLHPKEEA